MKPGAGDDARSPSGAATRRREILVGLGQGAIVGVLAVAGYLAYTGGSFFRHRPAAAPMAADTRPPTAIAVPAPAPALVRHLDFGSTRPPDDVSRVAGWAVREADNGTLPFAIVDKRRAQVYVFEAGGRLLGTSPVLLGYAAGDHTVAGIGNKAIEDIKPQERTTPAGRFVSEPGRNSLGHDVVWVDYDAAVSMHRVRATNPKERRLERLATPTPADNRISWGCINVPVAFFDETVWPHLGRGRAVVYVLPESSALTAFFPGAAPAPVLAQAGRSGPGNNAKP